MNEKLKGFIHNAYECLKNGEGEPALAYLQEALRIDFEHQELLYTLKCLNWWLEKIKRLDDFSDLYEQGAFILSQWKYYLEFLDRIGDLPDGEACDSCQYALKRFVFSKALGYFLALLRDRTNQQDPDLLYQAGRCYKSKGDWVDAHYYLEQASRFRKDDGAILSELADAKALLGYERDAKVLFREAFFLDPKQVYLAGMESEMILGLWNKVKERGYAEVELAEWIPVWGRIWGIFSIKRELKPVEVGRLKQSILSLENEYRSKSGGDPVVKPRLLNHYFWLIDHCEYSRDASGLTDETLLKIKFIDPDVYEQYRN